jgi:hypothetical protein
VKNNGISNSLFTVIKCLGNFFSAYGLTVNLFIRVGAQQPFLFCEQRIIARRYSKAARADTIYVWL